MQKGDEVYFYDAQKTRWNYTFVRLDDCGAAIILNGHGTMICRPTEIRLKAEVDAEELEAKKVSLKPWVEVWESGKKTSKDMAEAMKCSVQKAAAMIRMCKVLGLIEPVSSD